VIEPHCAVTSAADALARDAAVPAPAIRLDGKPAEPRTGDTYRIGSWPQSVSRKIESSSVTMSPPPATTAGLSLRDREMWV
jgi:hypothetical protein